MSFNSLGLSDALLKAISKKGYTNPSPIQQKAIPPILEGKDVLASAQTGTGKTAGFTLPILQILSQGKHLSNRPVRALILTPTRELAAQILANIKEYSEFLDLRTTVLFGGVNQKPQVAQLRQGIDILVATPGRLLDLHNQGLLSLAKVEILVLDEADRMLDMGFVRDIEKIIKLVPSKRQNLMFSATFSKDIKKLATGILNNPVHVEATPENTTVDAITQKVYPTAKEKKTELIIKLITDGNWQQILVFTRTKQGANKLTESMLAAGIKAAARGLDIPLLPHVINFELPNIPEDYVHRIGRTGRAGANGEAISLFSPDETVFLRDIEKLIGMKLPTENIAGFEPDPNASTVPIKQGQGRQQRNSAPRKPKADTTTRSSNNSFGPRRPNANNDRRSR